MKTLETTGELRFTWRVLLASQALGVVFAFLLSLGGGFFGTSMGHPSLHFVCISVYLLCMVPITLAGDSAIGRGARPWFVYSLLLLINPVVSCTAAFLTFDAYPWFFHLDVPATRHIKWYFVDAGIHFSVGCGLCMLAFMNRRTADRMLEEVRSADLRRVELDRQLVESRLATAEAQMDPAMLLSVLAQVRQGLLRGEPDAESRLYELIMTLRSALRRTAVASAEVVGF
jgi:hypothetical protein